MKARLHLTPAPSTSRWLSWLLEALSLVSVIALAWVWLWVAGKVG